jgi:hypothetical protein
MAIIAITTNSSISVNADRMRRGKWGMTRLRLGQEGCLDVEVESSGWPGRGIGCGI